eukprot:gnl/TRDRNA2_/TRDRNA2_178069_c0_seq2.p2 gnl/TRDRNA2_/TRDRNA2_178069_c0~~gnl/TRDRNA2_/TRDRNA2_178069_c0_seq2.p2  ORF type:complete len:345 (-),score=-18.02 gnl/TRDRNA2_/TRDRNA2_178069_c0_seq2:1868-2902(-)
MKLYEIFERSKYKKIFKECKDNCLYDADRIEKTAKMASEAYNTIISLYYDYYRSKSKSKIKPKNLVFYNYNSINSYDIKPVEDSNKEIKRNSLDSDLKNNRPQFDVEKHGKNSKFINEIFILQKDLFGKSFCTYKHDNFSNTYLYLCSKRKKKTIFKLKYHLNQIKPLFEMSFESDFKNKKNILKNKVTYLDYIYTHNLNPSLSTPNRDRLKSRMEFIKFLVIFKACANHFDILGYFFKTALHKNLLNFMSQAFPTLLTQHLSRFITNDKKVEKVFVSIDQRLNENHVRKTTTSLIKTTKVISSRFSNSDVYDTHLHSINRKKCTQIKLSPGVGLINFFFNFMC